MNIKKLQEIAARYDFVVAETQEEKERLLGLGYTQVDFDLENVLPELFISYNQAPEFYIVNTDNAIVVPQTSVRLAA